MGGQFYICVSGGVVQEVLTDDRRLLNIPITIIDHDCDDQLGSHLVRYDCHGTEQGNVWREKPRFCSVDIVEYDEIGA